MDDAAQSMAVPPQSFRGLLDPVTLDRFDEEYRGRGHLHVPGAEDKFAGVFSWDALNRLLDMSTLWSSRTISMAVKGPTLPAEDYCAPAIGRDGEPIMRPDRDRVMRQVRNGATLVLNLTESLTPELAHIAGILQVVYGCPLKCNIYCSWRERQGFNAHFDHTDVFVLHIAGRKSWNLYEGFFENPVSETEFAFTALPRDFHDEKRGKIAERLDLTPGDLLYIPKGQYHDALASSEATLHLTFGIVQPNGVDLLGLIRRSLAEDPLFRAPLPHFDDIGEHEVHLKRLANRLAEIVAMPSTRDYMRNYQQGSSLLDCLPAYDLPASAPVPLYWVRRGIPASALAALSEQEREVARWLENREYVTMGDLTRAFALSEPGALRQAVERLAALRLIEPRG